MRQNGWIVLLTAIVGAFIGCGLFLAVMMMARFSLERGDDKLNVASSATPGMDALDNYRCPQGHTKIQIIRGIEDGFARAGEEPAIMRRELLKLPYYSDYYKETSHLAQVRDFDVGGVDANLFTFIDFPPQISQGLFVTRVKPLPGSKTDSIQFSDFTKRAERLTALNEFSMRLERAVSGDFEINSEAVIALEISEFAGRPDSDYPNLLAFLKSRSGATPLDLMIEDDVMVDFVGLTLCQKPLTKKGTTLASDSRNLFGPDVIYLGCRQDPNQHICDPYAGDTACNMKMPLGCYREGKSIPPDIKVINASIFVGGDILLTSPVAAGEFKSLREADDFCAANFGQGVRALSYHEGGGSVMLANGRVPPQTRMWVDVKDKPLANCWTNWEGSGVEYD